MTLSRNQKRNVKNFDGDDEMKATLPEAETIYFLQLVNGL